MVVQLCRQSTISGGGRAYDEPYVPEDLARMLADGWHLSHMTDMAGFSEREQEEFLLICGPRKGTQSHQDRRRAREHAQEKQSES